MSYFNDPNLARVSLRIWLLHVIAPRLGRSMADAITKPCALWGFLKRKDPISPGDPIIVPINYPKED